MTVLVESRDQHVEHIALVLLREFDDEIAPDRVVVEANRAYRDLCETARVESFIPILALRRALTSLQHAPRIVG
jgi:hypothetical protein